MSSLRSSSALVAVTDVARSPVAVGRFAPAYAAADDLRRLAPGAVFSDGVPRVIERASGIPPLPPPMAGENERAMDPLGPAPAAVDDVRRAMGIGRGELGSASEPLCEREAVSSGLTPTGQMSDPSAEWDALDKEPCSIAWTALVRGTEGSALAVPSTQRSRQSPALR